MTLTGGETAELKIGLSSKGKTKLFGGFYICSIQINPVITFLTFISAMFLAMLPGRKGALCSGVVWSV